MSFNEVNDETRKDLTRAEPIAFPILTILLLLVFRGAVAAAIPLLLDIFSILGKGLVERERPIDERVERRRGMPARAATRRWPA